MALWSICALGLGAGPKLAAQSDWVGFNWKTAQSGSFSTPSNWAVSDERFMVKPFVDSTATIAPRPGDGIFFPSQLGAYTVDMAGASSLRIIYFNGASDASFVLAGGLSVDEMFTPTVGTITFRGGGTLSAAKFYYAGGRLVLQGVTAQLNSWRGGPALALPLAGSAEKNVGGSPRVLAVNNAERQIIHLLQGSKLVTTGMPGIPGVTLEDESHWEHRGDSKAVWSVTLKGRSQFKAAAVEHSAAGTGMFGEGESIFEIANYNGTDVQLSSGSRMINQTASAGGDQRRPTAFVDGPGTEWQVEGAFSLRGATALFIRNQGTMTIGRGQFDNFGGGFLAVTGAGSSLQIRETLEIENYGSITAESGGLVTLPQAQFRGGGAYLVAKGSGGEFRASGPLVLHRGTVQVREGGKGSAQHLTLHEGQAQVWHAGSILTLAGNLEVGIEGAAQADIDGGGKIVSDAGYVGGTQQGSGTVYIEGPGSEWELKSGGFIGDAGKAIMFLSDGGKLKVSGQGAGLALGFDKTGRGDVRVSTQGELDARSAILAVGKEGEGILNVTGGTVTAGQLLIGESAFTNRVILTGTGSNLKVAGELVAGNGGTGVLQVRGGARADVRDLKVGVEAPSTSKGVGVGTVSIENANTVLSVTDKLAVGASEIGLLAVSSGARLEFLGTNVQVGAEGVGVLAVTGDQSRLMAATAALQVGVKGRGTFEISTGGQVYSQTGQIGIDGTGEVIVGHPEALWQIVSDLEIGVDDFGILTIDDQAQVHSKSGYLGRKGGATGNLFVLKNGLWKIENQLKIGDEGTAAMILSRGGKVELQGGLLQLAGGPNAEGKLSIELAGSKLTATNSAFEIGKAGQAAVQILGGGALHTGAAIAAIGPDSSAKITVVGPNSRWTVETELRLGVAGQAKLIVDNRGRVEVNGPLITGVDGTIEGEGTIIATRIIPAGLLSPGASPGTLSLEGAYEAQPTSTLLIEIGGATPGTQHDVVSLARGQASLGGKLALHFINGFAPRQNQLFHFLFAADGISGSFSTVEVTGLAPGFQYELRPSADGKTLTLAALNDGVAASAAEPARLSITRFGPQILVECASPTPGFILQTSPLGTPGTWSNLATNEHRLSFPPDSSARFFRMVQP